MLVMMVFSGLYLMGHFKQGALLDEFETQKTRLRQSLELQRPKPDQHPEPSPTLENKERTLEDVEVLEGKKKNYQRKLKGRREIDSNVEGSLVLTPRNEKDYEFTVMSNIQTFVRNRRAQALRKNVILRSGQDKEAFGFSDYANNIVTHKNVNLTHELDKQRAILDHLLSGLLDAGITDFIAVRRENMENRFIPTLTVAGRDMFVMDPKVSAKVTDAIDTYAFQLEFIGYTDSLRDFFNFLSAFELAVVVRDVLVKRQGQEVLAATAPKRSPSLTTNTPFPSGTLFNPAGDLAASSNPRQDDEPEQQPVVDKNFSRYSIILEFIELIKPVEEIAEGP